MVSHGIWQTVPRNVVSGDEHYPIDLSVAGYDLYVPVMHT